MSMNAAAVRSSFPPLLMLAVAAAAWRPADVRGQVLDQPVKGFEYSDFDKATGKLKWTLKGDQAEQIPNDNNRLLLTGARMVLFDDKGNSNVVVAPKCVYDTKVKQVTSAEGLKVSTGDGRFSIEGVGFVFQQADSSLVISNQVRATVRKDVVGSRSTLPGPTNSPVAPPAVGAVSTVASNQVVQIFSDRFRFQTNLGVFRDNVRVVDLQGTLVCGVLTIQLAEAGRQIDRIIAEERVIVESGEMRATGDRGIYELAGDRDEVTLTGHPTWQLGPREGRAEELVFERKTRHFRAHRDVRMSLPAGTLHQAGFFPSAAVAATNAAPTASRPVDVTCDEFDYTAGSPGTSAGVTVCQGNVKVDDGRAKLQCAILTIESALDSSRTERVVAEHEVVVEQGDDRVACGRAVYFAPDERIEMTGNPNWRVGSREGTSDRLAFDFRNRSFGATGAVRMKLPPGSTGSSSWLVPTEIPLTEVNVAPTSPAVVKVAEPVEIASDDFEFKSAPSLVGMDVATYRGRVHVRDPGRMTLDCGVMTGRMFPGSNRMQTVVAEQDVVIQSTGPQGDRVGRGDLAVYSAEREEVELTGKDGVDIRISDKAGESRARGRKIVYTRGQDLALLTGDPVITSPKGEVTGDTVVYDHANSTLRATGNWKMKLKAESVKPAALPAGLPTPKRKPVRTGVKANADS